MFMSVRLRNIYAYDIFCLNKNQEHKIEGNEGKIYMLWLFASSNLKLFIKVVILFYF